MPGDQVVGVVEGFADELPDVRGPRHVDVAAALATNRDKAGEAELRQVLARCRWRRLGQFGEGSDVMLVAAEQPEKAQTGGVGEQGEGTNGSVDLRRSWELVDVGFWVGNDICSFAHMF